MSRLICCTPDAFNHIINPRSLRFNNPVALAVIILHKTEYWSANEVDDSEV